MANRSMTVLNAIDPRRLSLTWPAVPSAREVRQTARSLPGRVPRGRALVQLLWQAFWLPLWIGSDVPPPHLPLRESRPGGAFGPAGDHVWSVLGQITRRVWFIWAMTVIARAMWLPVAAGCIWLLASHRGAPPAQMEPLLIFGGILVGLSVLLAVTLRPSRHRTARMLDRSFGLHERSMTALNHLGRDVPMQNERTGVVYLQVADAANVVTEARQHSALALRPPVREIVLGIAIALLFTALSFLRGGPGDIPGVGDLSVTAFVPASERLARAEAQQAADQTQNFEQAPTLEEVEARAQRSNDAQQNLGTLSDALNDHAVTRPAADAITSGEYEQAGDELREAGQNADEMSASSREALAGDLDSAAEQISDPDLAQSSRDAANGMREGGQAAEQGMSDLADSVEETGNDVVDQQELADQMDQAQANNSESSQGESGGESAGQESSTSQSGSDSKSGESQSGSDGQAGEQEDSGESGESGESGGESDSQSGGGENALSGESGQSGEDGSGAEGEQGQSGQEGSGGQEGAAAAPQQGDDDGSGQDGSGGQTDEPSRDSQSGQSGEAQESSGQSEQGTGTSTGEGQPLSSDETAQPPTDSETSEGVAAAERVSGPEDGDGQTPADGEEGGDGVISLSGSDGQGVQTGNDPSRSRSGSGSGSAVSGGWATQGEVGEAGPDSNRVPPDYRDIVEDYFSPN